jgi:polyisoprenoid-binding protein YceI
MTRRLLQWLGVAFVLAVLGVGVGSLLVVKDRVRIVFQQDRADAGPEPVALLRDDLGVLTRDVGELRAALAANLERLGAALEERAVVRHADVEALARELAQVQQRLDGLHAELQRAKLPTGTMVEPSAAGAAVEEPPTEPVAVAAVVPPPPEPAAVPSKAGGFLSFSLPTATFAFDREQRYQLVPELCRVGFDAKSTLHDFSGVTSQVAGQFTADFDDPQGAWRGEVTCEAVTLVTGVDGRDTNMREYLDTTQHKQIRFEIERFVPAAGGVDVGRQTARGEIRGQMHIRGVARELRMPVTVEVDASRRVLVVGQAPLKLSDYQVPVPSQLGVINMQDEVVIWISLRARVQMGDRR